MQRWQEQQLSVHREMYYGGRDCDHDSIAYDAPAAALTVEGQLLNYTFCDCSQTHHLIRIQCECLKV